jgi:hypothetical protein
LSAQGSFSALVHAEVFSTFTPLWTDPSQRVMMNESDADLIDITHGSLFIMINKIPLRLASVKVFMKQFLKECVADPLSLCFTVFIPASSQAFIQVVGSFEDNDQLFDNPLPILTKPSGNY